MLNKIQIIGRLGKDPEVRHAPNGDAVCNFSVATTERWKDKVSGEQQESTEWHRVSAWGRVAEIAGQYLKKGALVYVEGKMTSRKYADQSGVERTSYEIRLQEMKMLGARDEAGGQPPVAAPRQNRAPAQQGGHRPGPPGGASQAARPSRAPAPPAGGSGFDDMDDDIPF